MNTPTPQLAYWKWGPEYLEGDTHLDAVRRFFAVGGLNLLVILMDLAERGYNHPDAMRRLREMVAEAHRLGGRVAFGVDVRYLATRLAERYPDDNYGVVEPVTGTVDAAGVCRVTYDFRLGNKPPVACAIERACLLRPTDACHYDPASLRDIADATIADGALVARVGPESAGQTVLFFPVMRFARLDLFSAQLLPEYGTLMDRFADVPLDGMTTDEMGLHIPHDPGALVRKFHYSAPLAAAYRNKTGRALRDDLPALRLAPAGDDGVRHRALNAYFELIRERCVEIESFLYAETKRRCGPDAFVGLHATFWNESAHEVFHDGLDWWDVPRDYAQTDEEVCLPIRLALTRKGGPVWYNMWYTNGELHPASYFREALRYARFGGRMHYHSYLTHSEKQLVGEIGAPGVLERVARMEAWIARLNRFQRSQPDARVAIVVGSAALTNWALEHPHVTAIPPDRGVLPQAVRFANGLLHDCGWLCDLLPDYEIEHGEFGLEPDGRLRYGVQTYDALVYLCPECIKPAVLDFLRAAGAAGTRWLCGGTSRWFFDGAGIGDAFETVAATAAQRWPGIPSPERVAGWLRRWNVPMNRWANGCLYQDGSAIFVAAGEAPEGNPLQVDVILRGYRVRAEGEDFLAIRLATDGRVEELLGNGAPRLTVAPAGGRSG